MEKDTFAQLIIWHQEDEHEKIVDRIMEIPQLDRDYDTVSLLARALNNLERYDEALQQLLAISKLGENDPLWHFRVGYSYYYLEQYEEALREFEITDKLDPEDRDTLTLLDWSRGKVERNNKKLKQSAALKVLNEQTTDNEASEVPFVLSVRDNDSASFEYLKDMYIDGYYPNFLVDKVKAELVKVVEFLEQGNQDVEEIQSKLDFAIHAINDLAVEFDENDSEIETVARESIAQTVEDILAFFGIEIDTEEAIRERDW
ncbi:tetratricopeptide (TPR) repeat protein [Filibacter limicola]|uniref:Tetratricopeptide (TPR) repeat protein n=1 Tax=Sporosarcina limicola TaxID=34101 RepID=A0A927R5K2_9BACL|nr:tetratricopeptide (TPR) repeat protein [Sporosarcina limicola]